MGMCVHMYTYIYMYTSILVYVYACLQDNLSTTSGYGVATISKLLKIIGLVRRISSLLKGSFAKETYNLRSLQIEATPYLFQ